MTRAVGAGAGLIASVALLMERDLALLMGARSLLLYANTPRGLWLELKQIIIITSTKGAAAENIR